MTTDLTSCFLIVDASGLLYRSFFAVKGLVSPSGAPTGALYGFVRSIIKAVGEFKPKFLSIVFDGPNSKASRIKLYREYKAHRKPMPPELLEQLQEARKFCSLAGLPFLDISGVEADDTIATLADHARREYTESPVVILSADKDLMQLVSSPRLFLVDPMKEYAHFDDEAVWESWGLRPCQIRDFLAIVGDSSDNVPGVDGIGAKGGLELIKEWESVDNIYRHLEEIPPKMRKKLEKGRDMAFLSLSLVTLNTSVEIPSDSAMYAYSGAISNAVTSKALEDFYREKGFKSLLKEIPQKSALETMTSEKVSIIDTEEACTTLFVWLENCSGPIVIDTETTSLDEYEAELVGVGIGLHKDRMFYIDFAHSSLDPYALVVKIDRTLSERGISIVGHNCKYDLHVLHKYGFCRTYVAFDTLVASWLLDPEERSHSLDRLSSRILHHEKIPIESLIGPSSTQQKQGSMKDVPQALIAPYCIEDVQCTSLLYDYFSERLSQHASLQKLFQDVEMPLLPVLFGMEERGIFLDPEVLVPIRAHIQEIISVLEKKIFEAAGEEFNINSPKQLGHILYEKLGLPTLKKGKSAPSTNADVLEELAVTWPIAAYVLEYRQLEKLRSTYIDTLPSYISPMTGRIHCHFLQSGTATGRLSCQDPNLQNIPVRSELGKEIRRAFRPRQNDWSFVSFDYSQIELRLLAHISQDPTLVENFRTGGDIHAATAARIFHVDEDSVTQEMRQRAKAINFGVIYGQRGFGLSKELRISLKEANEFIQAYFHRYQLVEKTLEGLKEKARVNGYAETLTGRIRPLPDINSSNQMVRSAQERLAVNTPFQGTAADIIKMAMIEIAKRLQTSGLQAHMLLQIHDELLFEAPDGEVEQLIPIVRDVMQSVMPLSVPLDVHIAIGKNWREC